MSKLKEKPQQPPTAGEAAQAEADEDPMTSFGPEPGAAPAERPPQGNGSEQTAPAAGAEAPQPPTPEAAAPEPEAAEPSPEQVLQARLESTQQEAAANFDRVLRLQAEFDNYKKRIQKEHADSLRYALTPLVSEVAGVLDNLERAVAHARSEQREDEGALLAGIEMVAKQMHEALARVGVTRIEAAGKPFDPALHEAMTVVERSDVPENQVLEEFQAGYLLHDRVVRPARVSVSKRGNGAGQEATPAGT